MRRRRTGFLLLAAAAFWLPIGSAAQQAEPGIPYETFTLPNGLVFIVHEDHSSPIVAVDVWYDVGSANEQLGRSGFAHLFEHLMFEETKNLSKGDFDDYLTAAGGMNNGSTTEDRTNYFEVVPSNRVNLALWLESERMANLSVTQANFTREREVVKEERRLRVDNQPYGAAMLTLDTLSTDWFPYKHTVIGTMADLDSATVVDVMAFHDMYYVPNNAAIAVAGDVTAAEVRAMAERYFGAIQRGPEKAALPPVPATPRTDGERRVVLDDRMASIPLYSAVYSVPPHGHADTYALSLLSSILGRGESSRLYQRLVKDERAALMVSVGVGSNAGPGTFVIRAFPNRGVAVSRVEDLVYDEIAKLQADGVTMRELEKAKNQVRASMVMGRQSVLQKAEALQHYRRYHGDLSAMETDLDRYMAVTSSDIRRVANRYLTVENRTVVIARPAQQGDASTDAKGGA
ncbi:MAG TPA: pitrilysin family protein [Longimicrobiales bacterium]|nr:pitrilysin family protein [Longimicrobiales bacterium]